MNYEDDYEKRGFLQKYGFVLGIGAIGITVGAMVIGQITKGSTAAPRRTMPEVVMIRPLPPPPPPPPEPPKEVIQKMIEQDPINQPEDKPDDSPKDQSPAVSTNITGPGGDSFGLSGPGAGGSLGGLGGGGHHSRFGWYAGQVQRVLQDALQKNPVTSRADFTRRVLLWADASGRVTRVKLDESKDDAAINRAIDETLTGLQLEEPPPKDMPMPIHLRFTARRPN
jgi:hypothetical protein